MAGSHTDTAERNRLENELHECEQKLRSLAESTYLIIFIVDENGIFQLSEGKGLAKLGLQPGQVVGQSAFELYKDTPSILEGLRKALAGETNHIVTVVGDLVFDTVYSPYVTTDGRQNGVIGVAIDITERERAEAVAKEHQQRLALAVQGADLGSWDWNVQTGETRFNERWAEMLGYRLEEIEPHVRTWEDLVHPEDLPRVLEVLTTHLEGGTLSYEAEYRMRHKSGSWVWVLDSGKVIHRDATGQPVRAAGTHLDISERKRTEEDLEKRFLALTQPLDTAEDIAFEDLFSLSDMQHLQDLYAEAFGVAALITRPDGTPITQPSNFTYLCGEIIRKTENGSRNCSESDALIGRHNPLGPNIQTCLSAGLCNAGAGITVGGRHVANWLIGQVRSEVVDNEKILQYAREIGADEEAFRTAYLDVPFMSQQQFERVARVLFVVTNQISATAYQNIQQARFIADRKRAEQALRQSEAKFRSLVENLRVGILIVQNGRVVYQNPEQERFLAGRFSVPFPAQSLLELVHPEDRHIFQNLCKLAPHKDSIPPDAVLRLVPSGEDEMGGTRWANCSCSYIEFRGEKAQLVHMIDITPLKNLERFVMQRERMASLGHVAAGIAHEIRNPLSGINIYLHNIRDCYQDPECAGDVMKLIQEAMATSHKIESVIKRVLDFSRPAELKMQPTSVNDTIVEAVKLSTVNLRKVSVRLDMDLDPDIRKIYADGQLLEQLFLNLISNAADVLKAVEGERCARITTRMKNGHVLIQIEDSGPGIPPEMRERVFDPFFTTRNEGIGIGLGICKRITVDHGGDIYVSASSLGGAQFNILLPVEKRRAIR